VASSIEAQRARTKEQYTTVSQIGSGRSGKVYLVQKAGADDSEAARYYAMKQMNKTILQVHHAPAWQCCGRVVEVCPGRNEVENRG